MIEALEESLGVVTTACRKVGISRDAHYRWKKDDREYAARVDALSNVALDFAESKLFSLIQDQNPTAIIFYLKTQGKGRGYYEHRTQDITSGNQPITINMIPVDPQHDD